MQKLTFLIILLLVSCNRNAAKEQVIPKTIQQAIISGEESGVIPELNHDKTIEGTDANQNGIRDDVERYIASLPDTASQKSALMQHAKAVNSALTVNTKDTAALSEISKAMMNNTICLFSVYGSAQAQQKGRVIEKVTVNTRERLAAYEKFNIALSGTTAKIPVGSRCEK